MRRGIAAAMAGAAIVAGATLWFATRSPEPVSAPRAALRVTARAAPTPSASPVSASDARLACAVSAAFPDGTLLPNDDAPMELSARLFDAHALIDLPSGPVLVSVGQIDKNASHTDEGTIRVSYLRERTGAFTIARTFPEVISGGSWGSFYDWSISDRFTGLPVVQAEGGGQTRRWVSLVELRPEGPMKVGDFQSFCASQAEPGPNRRWWEGKVVDIERNKAFTVRYTGSMAFDERYVWRDGRFVLDGKSRVPEC